MFSKIVIFKKIRFRMESHKCKNGVVIFCPYERHNPYGFIDEDGYYRCNSYYCTDSKFGSLHKKLIDCIRERIFCGEWDEYDMDEFETDYQCYNDDEWIACYDLIKSEGKPVTKETDRLGKMIKDDDETNGGDGIEDK